MGQKRLDSELEKRIKSLFKKEHRFVPLGLVRCYACNNTVKEASESSGNDLDYVREVYLNIKRTLREEDIS